MTLKLLSRCINLYTYDERLSRSIKEAQRCHTNVWNQFIFPIETIHESSHAHITLKKMTMQFHSQSNKRIMFYSQLEQKMRHTHTFNSRQPSIDVDTYFMAGLLHHKEVHHEQNENYNPNLMLTRIFDSWRKPWSNCLDFLDCLHQSPLSRARRLTERDEMCEKKAMHSLMKMTRDWLKGGSTFFSSLIRIARLFTSHHIYWQRVEEESISSMK